LSTEPASVCGQEQSRQGEQKGDEDEDGIDNTGCQRALAEQQVLSDIPNGWLFLHLCL
jgi:hypothetical protein